MKIISKMLLTLLVSYLLSVHTVFANLPKSILDTFPATTITKGKIIIKAPAIAENGAVVNISIDKILISDKSLHVTELWIFDHFRTKPMAHFRLGESALPNGLSSRYKLVGSSVVYAVALLSDGSMISGEKAVKVTIGGCGGGGPTHTGQYYVAPPYTPAFRRGYTASVNLSAVPRPAGGWTHAEKYSQIKSNGIVLTENQPVSTFSADVDTGSYSNIRRFLLKQGQLPVVDAVRVEEMVNYFSYQYPQPRSKDTPFTVSTEVGPSPWNRDTHLLQIGIQGYQEDRNDLPPANLVFLVDVSGSMRSHDKIGLLKSSLRMLSRQLSEQDRIAIVVYAGASGVVLDTTPGNDTNRIIRALNTLSAGGSTNGGAGIHLAYRMAKQSFIKNGINRVILATDGDFNVGTVNHQALIDLIEKKRESGITLTTLGFGTGNYNEKLMEQLADHGNGNYAYIDTLQEARKVLVTQLASTLYTIARDVKIQVEFNPAIVAEYRLVGYENRLLNREDFKNDKVDAGDVGAGHTVTALYEVAFAGSEGQSVAPLRYARKKPDANRSLSEIAFVRLRYKRGGEDTSQEIRHPVYRVDVQEDINRMSDNYRFASAVAAFGQILRNSSHIRHVGLEQVHQLASNALGNDAKGYRKEFLDLVDTAGSLTE